MANNEQVMNELMQSLANQVRVISGKTELMGIETMANTLDTENSTLNSKINTQDDLIESIKVALSSGNKAMPTVDNETIRLQSKTVTPSTVQQAVVADDGYHGLLKVTVNAMPTATQATPSISVNSSGLITTSATQSAGYVSAGTKSATKQLSVQAAQIITPSTTDQTIASGKYLTGTQTIKGDANLIPENIAEGINIFGVVGSHSGGSGGGSSDNEILLLTREITTYSNPTITTLGTNAFNSCAKLTSINLPSLTTMGASALMECTKLTQISLPSLTAVPNSGFRRCLGLVKADFANATSIAAYAFYQCTHLETLILRSNSICTLANTTTALNETLIVKGTGYVYVPSALVDSYKAATNWTTYANQFRAIEDYPDICG